MGTPASMKNLVDIVESRRDPVLVIVSALGGVTDLLINCARLASQGSPEYLPGLRSIKHRHREMIEVMVKHDKEEISTAVEEMLGHLSDIFRGISLLREVSERSMDIIVSFGERMSSLIVSGSIEGASHVNSLDIVRTEKWYNRNIASAELTKQAFCEMGGGIEAGAPIVMGGFISRDSQTGDITNLGRGGSDYTAALAAAALDAECLEIWTDVDGFMTADPRIIPTAKVMDKMSFIDSIELCNFGAKVVYPPTIYPVFHKNIPIKVLNTFNPSAPGTLICEAEAINCSNSRVVGVSALRTAAYAEIKVHSGEDMDKISERALTMLSKKGVQVLLVDGRNGLGSMAFAINSSDMGMATDILTEEFAPELATTRIDIVITPEVSVIAIVGEKLNDMHSLPVEVKSLSMRHNIHILGAPAAPTPTTYTVAVSNANTDSMLRLLHEALIE